MNHEKPVNKDAALFLTRKKHIQTVQEALNKFAMAISSPATVSEIRKILQDKALHEESKSMSITMTLKPDTAKPNRVFITMHTRIQNELGREIYRELEC